MFVGILVFPTGELFFPNGNKKKTRSRQLYIVEFNDEIFKNFFIQHIALPDVRMYYFVAVA